MPKLWIVHRNPQSRAALAQIAGLAASELVSGAPRESDFALAPDPAAFMMGLEGDFELELEFAHRLRTRLSASRWILLADPEDAAEAARLFDSARPVILEPMPSATDALLRYRTGVLDFVDHVEEVLTEDERHAFTRSLQKIAKTL